MGVLAALTPSVGAYEWGQSGCGEGTIFLGDSVSFGHAVAFTRTVTETSGYLVDCVQGADAYLELTSEGSGVWTYAVWGQLGSYS